MLNQITSYTSGIPVFDAKTVVTLPGGFQLIVTNLIAGTILPAGSALIIDEAARTATVLKSVSVYANATNSATTIQVAKGSQFKVGDDIGKATGVKSIDITAIDTSNANYDTLTVSATLGYALTAGDTLVQATSASSTAAIAVPKGLLYNDTFVINNATCSAGVGGIWYLRRIPPLATETQKALSPIIFTNSK